MAAYDVQGGKAFAGTGGVEPDAAKSAVILIHGAGMDRTVWQLQTRRIAHAGFAAYAIDLPGHGRSEGAARESIAGYADWIIAFMDAARLKTAALIGHSMGSLIAMEAAARVPGRIEALALLGAAVSMPVHPGLIAAAERGEALAAELIADWAHGAAMHQGGHPQPGLWVMGAGQRIVERSKPGVLAGDLKACDAYGGAADVAARVTPRTLVLSGAQDKMTPAKAGKALSEAIAGAQFTVMPGVGHMMMTEAPDATFDALKPAIQITG